ncbi:multiubiquitin domain-containing protein [Xanthomonas sacchari]
MNIEAKHHQPPDTLTIVVNGKAFPISDITPTGRQILSAARLRPETDHALVRWPEDGPTSVIELDEVSPLAQTGSPSQFFAAKADGVKYFILDDTRYAWPGALTLTTLRQVARVPDGFDVWIEHRGEKPDEQIADNAAIDLDQHGIERFFTAPLSIKVFVNTREAVVHKRVLSYWDVVHLEHPEAGPQDTNTTYTVSYAQGPAENPAGNLLEHQAIHIKQEMEFYVVLTDKS